MQNFNSLQKILNRSGKIETWASNFSENITLLRVLSCEFHKSFTKKFLIENIQRIFLEKDLEKEFLYETLDILRQDMFY